VRDEDKPFVCYRRGRWQMRIKPRNGAGWRAFGWWMLAFAIATGLHVWAVTAWEDRNGVPAIATTAYLAFVAGWTISMIRWMLARSVVVTLDDPPKRGRR
jgi:hypothetical protein